VAVRIRLKRLGRAHRAHWRICATDKRAARDGRVIEELGYYDPLKPNEDKIQINRERLVHWLKAGGAPSKTVTELLAHVGLDAKGNQIPPRPWKKKKEKGPPPKAAERVAAEKAKADEEAPPEVAEEPAPAPEQAQPETPAAEPAPEAPPDQQTPPDDADRPDNESADTAEPDTASQADEDQPREEPTPD